MLESLFNKVAGFHVCNLENRKIPPKRCLLPTSQLLEKVVEDFVREPFKFFVSRRRVWCKPNKEMEYLEIKKSVTA